MGDENYYAERAEKLAAITAAGVDVKTCWVTDPSTYSAVLLGCVIDPGQAFNFFNSLGYFEN